MNLLLLVNFYRCFLLWFDTLIQTCRMLRDLRKAQDDPCRLVPTKATLGTPFRYTPSCSRCLVALLAQISSLSKRLSKRLVTNISSTIFYRTKFSKISFKYRQLTFLSAKEWSFPSCLVSGNVYMCRNMHKIHHQCQWLFLNLSQMINIFPPYKKILYIDTRF